MIGSLRLPSGDWQDQQHPEWEARCMEVYAAMVDRMDQGIGRIVETLRGQDALDNTLILFLQDNGGCQENVGRRGNAKRPAVASLPKIGDAEIRLDVIPKQNRAGVPTLQGPNVMPGPEDTYIAYGINWANASNTPFREYKHFVHEGGISTPLIAHWPQGIRRAGQLEAQPGHLIDVMATCVDVSGADYPLRHGDQKIRPMEGASLKPAFEGGRIARTQPLFWEHEGNRAVRDGHWKLVAKENRPWELYDMRVDRTEMNDLANKMPERVAELAASWDAWAERANVLPLGAWRGNSNAKLNRRQRRFELNAGASLPKEKAPYPVKRSISISVQFDKPAADGVLLAQGGSAEGYSLFFQEGQLHFSIRRGGRLATVASKDVDFADVQRVSANLDATGSVTLTAGDEVVARGSTPGLLTKMPIDGLDVGEDRGGAVGPYDAPFAFPGKIQKATVRLGKQ